MVKPLGDHIVLHLKVCNYFLYYWLSNSAYFIRTNNLAL